MTATTTIIKATEAAAISSVVRVRTKKSVQFAEQLAVFRPFDILDSPSTVSGNVPMSLFCPLPLDFARRLNTAAVLLQSISLNNNCVEGTIVVKNIAFTKHITLSTSFDNWVSKQEVVARYTRPVYNSKEDRDLFSFSIEIPNHLTKSTCLNTVHSLCFAICYKVAGNEFWDNNMNNDYKVLITPQINVNPSDYEWYIYSNYTEPPKVLSGLSRLAHSRGKQSSYFDDSHGTGFDGATDENGFAVVKKNRSAISLYSPLSSNFGITAPIKNPIKKQPPVKAPVSKPPQRISTYIPFFDLPYTPTNSIKTNLVSEKPLPVNYFDSIPLKGPIPAAL